MATSAKVTLLLLTAAACVSVLLAGVAKKEVSDDAIEMAINDKRYFDHQLKCALGEGHCDTVGRRLKTFAPLVLRGACPQCSPKETEQIKRVLSHIQRHYPKEWAKLIKQYSSS